MSLSRYDSGYSGQSYDRNVFEANLSTVNKLQRDYWNAKQVLRKKLGKEDDQHVIASDSELDSKLDIHTCRFCATATDCQSTGFIKWNESEVGLRKAFNSAQLQMLFHSVQTTCSDLIKTIEKYQSCICVLSRDENAMGRFLKEQGALDRTSAGKMMIAVGKAQCYTSQQRLNLRHTLSRLCHDIETFRYRAIGDSVLSVDQMEDSRTHYRASLRWMQDISSNLDPEQYKKLEKFRKVQNEVRLNKEKFDRKKWAVCQKVDLLCASRSNLFSNTLVPYQNEILKFWEKTAHTMAAVLENMRDYQNYEFKLLKGLNPIQDIDGVKKNEDKEESVKSEVVDQSDDEQLINLSDQETSQNQVLEDGIGKLTLANSDKDLLMEPYRGSCNGNNGDVYHDIQLLDELNVNQPFLATNENEDLMKTTEPDNLLLGTFEEDSGAQPTKEDLNLLNDILGDEGQAGAVELEQQWQSVFGDFMQAAAPEVEPNSAQVAQPASDELLQNIPQQPSANNYLPSQLMDMMMAGQPPAQNNQFSFGMQQPMYMGQAQAPMMGQMMGYQPPSYQSMFGSVTPQSSQQTQGNVTGSMKPMMQSQNKKDTKGNMSAWFNLFAELDPLQNPDALGKKKDEKSKDGGAC